MIAPTSIPARTEIMVSASIGHLGAFVKLEIAGACVYLDAKQLAALLHTLCEAELKMFVKVSAPAPR
jgi:hypothetical protein